ncbi:MAG: hypothetical protein DME21_04200 [Verrucomicrobia bacterium]|nr:MAG: hypothetical protein DME21_04200 [Verrucomicrobiota bacterium]
MFCGPDQARGNEICRATHSRSLSLEHVRGNARSNRFRRQIVIQFGGAMVLTSRLARTLAPTKMQIVPLPAGRQCPNFRI